MASSASTGAAATLARERARAILAESRFHSGPIPRPLHGLLHAVGSALESPLEALEELVSSLAADVPGGTITVWAALAAVGARAQRACSRRAAPAARCASREASAREPEPDARRARATSSATRRRPRRRGATPTRYGCASARG